MSDAIRIGMIGCGLHGTWAARDRRIAPRQARRRVPSTASDRRVVGIAVVAVVDVIVGQSIIGPLVGHLGSAALLALITGWTRQPH